MITSGSSFGEVASKATSTRSFGGSFALEVSMTPLNVGKGFLKLSFGAGIHFFFGVGIDFLFGIGPDFSFESESSSKK